jgi:putative phage-type endonuclease
MSCWLTCNTEKHIEGTYVPDFRQGSDEWKEWRKDKIGASDAPIIMGVSKFTTPWQLYMRKLGLIPEQSDNHAMARGREKESKALEEFNKHYGCNCVPAVMQHDRYPWMIASLDGWDQEKGIAVEIKCPGKEDHETACKRKVPDHYVPQLQHQMEVLGADCVYYWSWYKDAGVCVTEVFDKGYVNHMLHKEMEFVLRMKTIDPPELSEKDYVENYSREWRLAVEYYGVCKKAKQYSETAYDNAREEIIRLSDGHNCKGNGLKITKSVRKGSVDYADVLDDLGFSDIDLDPYRKEKIVTWRVSEE